MTHSWEDARGECELYGGWLVAIKSLEEQNCLMRHGKSEGYNAWYWTDGKNLLEIILHLFIAFVILHV